MNLYLVRHGKAEAGEDDRARRLTQHGRDDVARMARYLAAHRVRPGRIEHSSLIRARETAELLAGEIGGEVTQVPDLLPDADPRSAVCRLVAGNTGAVMLVGHLPYMERMASVLLTGHASTASITFATAAVALFEGGGGGWTLEWLLSPRVV